VWIAAGTAMPGAVLGWTLHIPAKRFEFGGAVLGAPGAAGAGLVNALNDLI
jgi:hypothetical protein